MYTIAGKTHTIRLTRTSGLPAQPRQATERWALAASRTQPTGLQPTWRCPRRGRQPGETQWRQAPHPSRPAQRPETDRGLVKFRDVREKVKQQLPLPSARAWLYAACAPVLDAVCVPVLDAACAPVLYAACVSVLYAACVPVLYAARAPVLDAGPGWQEHCQATARSGFSTPAVYHAQSHCTSVQFYSCKSACCAPVLPLCRHLGHGPACCCDAQHKASQRAGSNTGERLGRYCLL